MWLLGIFAFFGRTPLKAKEEQVMSVTCKTSGKSDDPILCIKPGCPLKKSGIDTRYLANIFLLALGDGFFDNSATDSERSKTREQCIHCSLGVLEGRKTYPTREEWLQLVALGNWHRRRRSRRSRRYH